MGGQSVETAVEEVVLGEGVVFVGPPERKLDKGTEDLGTVAPLLGRSTTAAATPGTSW
jgi:hypothetical protein